MLVGGVIILSREDIIERITKCVDCAMPALQNEEGLEILRGYSFMLDNNKRVKANIVFEDCA